MIFLQCLNLALILNLSGIRVIVDAAILSNESVHPCFVSVSADPNAVDLPNLILDCCEEFKIRLLLKLSIWEPAVNILMLNEPVFVVVNCLIVVSVFRAETRDTITIVVIYVSTTELEALRRAVAYLWYSVVVSVIEHRESWLAVILLEQERFSFVVTLIVNILPLYSSVASPRIIFS